MERAPVWGKAAPLPGLCADEAALLAQGSRAPTLDLIFHVGCTHRSSAVGVAPFVPALPLLEKKTCMISYMKDICNWTAGPMQYIYNSKQNTLKPAPHQPPHPFLPEEIYLHIFKKKIKKIDKTQVIILFTRFISHVNVENSQVHGSGSSVVLWLTEKYSGF